MNDLIIRAVDLTKIYRLYSKPHYRFLDMFGFLRGKENSYTEHAALEGINLTIRKGEKVAFIGRNGAGKSTLLKIVTRVIEPTSGSIDVFGKVSALLQIGTGFHPDFTGRENVYSYLAQLGIVGSEADAKCSEIVDFAELKEYIDQPVKTYSTGMGARLMFATATAIMPEVLVLDEVLGVGDAYFTHKSYERIRKLCEREGTTVLLVTHDIYSAMKICERMIWIDRGRMVADGASAEVLKAYEASIKLQEEERLRQLTLLSWQAPAGQGKDQESLCLFFQVVPENRVAMQENLPVAALRLTCGGKVVDEIDIRNGKSSGRGGSALLLDTEQGNWGEAYCADGLWLRDFRRFGSIFQRAPFVFSIPRSFEQSKLDLEMDIIDACRHHYFIETFSQDGRTLCSALNLAGNNLLKTIGIPVDLSSLPANAGRQQMLGLKSHSNLAASGEFTGNRRLRIDAVSMYDGAGSEAYIIPPLSDMDIRIAFGVEDKNLAGNFTCLVGILKDGCAPITRLIADRLHIEAADGPSQEVVVRLRPILLGPGQYSLTVGLFEEDYFSDNSRRHIASSSMVMDLRRNAFQFEISCGNPVHYRMSYLQQCEWIVNSTPDRQDEMPKCLNNAR